MVNAQGKIQSNEESNSLSPDLSKWEGVHRHHTRSLAERIRRHIAYARAGRLFALSCAIRKYGEEAFTSEILAAGTWEEMQDAEIAAIAAHNAMGAGGYNMTGGGEGSLNVSLPESTKLKISAALTAREFSESHRARLSEVQRGKTISAETREKMRIAAKNRARVPMSDEQREKRRMALKGRKRSPELMARIWETRRRNAAKE